MREDSLSLAWALVSAAVLRRLRGEQQAHQELVDESVAIATEHGFALLAARGTVLRGRALVEQEQTREGIALMRQGLAAHRATRSALAQPGFLALLAEGYQRGGQAEEGLSVLDEALGQVEQSGERRDESSLYRLKGELLLMRAVPDDRAARPVFTKLSTLPAASRRNRLNYRRR